MFQSQGEVVAITGRCSWFQVVEVGVTFLAAVAWSGVLMGTVDVTVGL